MSFRLDNENSQNYNETLKRRRRQRLPWLRQQIGKE